VKLHTRIFIGLFAGIVLGAIAKVPAAEPLRLVLLALEPLGTGFVKLITMVVVPLVIGSLLVGIGSLGSIARVGRIGGRTLAFFLATTVVGAAIGLLIARLARLGEGMDPAVRDALAGRSPVTTTPAPLSGNPFQIVVDMIPANPIGSAAQADLLGLTIALVIFGSALTVITELRRRILLDFFQSINELCMVVVGWLMTLAPFGVFVLIAAMVARVGLDLLRSLFVYCVVVVAALAIHVLVVLVPALRLGAGLTVWAFVRSVADALMVAFSTSSSNATLPVSMAAATNRLGISSSVVSFVLPAGTKLNLNGSAIYKAVTAVFLAGLYGIHLGPTEHVVIVFASTIGALAGVGVPGSSLVTTLIVLNAIGLGPHAAAGIALVAGIDRPLDMCRTTVNVTSTLVAAAVVARAEGEPLAMVGPAA
jgi:Na+/H+-dicarboxylate symporter